MSDYIKREDAEQALVNAFDTVPMANAVAHGILKDVPSADVVEVVRCKDCKWWDGNDCKARDIDVVDVDDFCSYGERRGE